VLNCDCNPVEAIAPQYDIGNVAGSLCPGIVEGNADIGRLQRRG
jgi:hypothetical protein